MVNPLTRFRPKGRQLDRLVARFTGQGSGTSPPCRLPRARYTVFVTYDPREAVRAFVFADAKGRRWPDWRGLPAAGEVTAPLVQGLLPAGTYRAEVETATPTCGYDIQVVLNSMQSWRAVPAACRPRSSPPNAATVRGDGSQTLLVEQTGRYRGDWWVGEPAVHRRVIHPYTLRLRAADGHDLELGTGGDVGGRRVDRRINPVFLSAGVWTVEMEANVPWELTVSPIVEPTGGGSRGF